MSGKYIVMIAIMSFFSLSGATELKTEEFFPGIASMWKVVPDPFSLQQQDSSLPIDKVQFRLRNGKTLVNLLPAKTTIAETSDILNAVSDYSDGLQVVHTLDTHGGIVLWKMKFINQSKEEMWLEPALLFPLRIDQADYWDGLQWHTLNNKPFGRDRLNHTFPLTVLLNGNVGFALGTPPIINSSFLANGVDKRNNLYYLTRIALPAGEKCDFGFVFYFFIPDFRQFSAIDLYYKHFPESFRPAPGTDERLTSGRYTDAMQSAHFKGMTSKKNVNAILNYCGMEWGYTLYRRQGDFYGRKENFDDYILSDGEKAKLQIESDRMMNKVNYEQMRLDLANIFNSADYRGNILLSFYLFNQVEKGLIEKGNMEEFLYVDIIGTPIYRRAWGLTHGLSGHIYPWATPFETILRKDLPELMRDFNIRSFCQDGYTDLDLETEIGRSEVYRGKLQYYLPGWSYDAKGKYIRKGIGLRHNAEFIHSLKVDGKTASHLANMWWGSPLFSFAPDAYIAECFDYKNIYGENFAALKQGQLFRGTKPNYLHDWGSLKIGDAIPYENMNKTQLNAVYSDYIRETILGFYQAGIVPSWYIVASHKPIARELRTMLNVISRGFSPVSTVQADGEIESVRYGNGLQSAVVLSNRKRQNQNIKGKLISKYISNVAKPLPMRYRGKFNAIIKNDEIEFSTPIQAQENIILVMPMALQFDSDQLLKINSQVKRNYSKITYDCKIDTTTTVDGILSVEPERTFEVDSILLNGEKIQPGKLTLKAGSNTLKLSLQSQYFRQEEKDYGKFDYSKATIILAEDAGLRETGTAAMLQDFMAEVLKVEIPVTKKANAGNQIILSTKNDIPMGIYLEENGNLRINHVDVNILQQMAWDFLHLLTDTDSRFERKIWSPLSGLTVNNKAMIAAMGYAGEPFDYPDQPEMQPIVWSSLSRSAETKTEDHAIIPKDLPHLKVPFLSEPIVLDGKLDDGVWGKIKPITDFTIFNRQDKPTQKTEVKVFADAENIYVGFRCNENNMSQTMNFFKDRDAMLWLDDDFEVRLAPGVDGKSSNYPYYVFITNIDGVQLDILQMPNQMAGSEAANFMATWGQTDAGTAWNASWQVKTFRGENYWSGEMRIPMSTMKAVSQKNWRIHFARSEQPNVEFSCWPQVTGTSINQPAYYATMEIEGEK
jgi:hypothetical protein